MKRAKILRLPASKGNIEKSEALKQARLEELEMHVVEFHYSPQTDTFAQLLDLIGEAAYHVESETKEVLTLRISPSGAVRCLISIPASESKAFIALRKELSTFNQISVSPIILAEH